MSNPVIKYIINNHFLAVLVVIALLWIVIQLSEILILIFISFIIMAALAPFSNYLTRKRVPRILSVVIPYTITVAILILLIFPLIPFFVAQIQLLLKNFPGYIEQVTNLFNFQTDPASVNKFFGTDINVIGKNALSVTGKIFSGIFSMLTIFVISFYFMLQRKTFRKYFTSLCPKKYQENVLGTISEIEDKIGLWVRGQMVLCFAIGFFTWIGLALLGLPYALPLALLAGVLEIVPTIGPIISAVPATIVALTISPGLAISIVIFYIILQALENNLLVPKIMEKAVGLNPIIIIIGVLVGGKFMGILGALLAVPIIATTIIITRSFKCSN